MNKRNEKEKLQKIARERIEILFQNAEESFSKDPDRSDRYIEIARRIAMKANIRLEARQKRSFCKYCYSFLVPGLNALVRIRNGKIITYCQVCRKHTRIPIKKKIKVL